VKNNILIDHVLIAVSQEEFEKYSKQSERDPRIKFKETITEDWSWRACFIAFEQNIYLEIVEENNYPNRVGLALSSLGEENKLLIDLQAHFSDWEFEVEEAEISGDEWYSGYFSSHTESEISFVWFMEYKGEHRLKRSIFDKEFKVIQDKMLTIILSEEEFSDYSKILSRCNLIVKKTGCFAEISDAKGRTFKVEINDKPLSQRVVF